MVQIEALLMLMCSLAAVDNEELIVEQRNVVSVAYNNEIHARHTLWHIISSIN
ncbi:hypothetical protein GLYMA_02G062352v4 [Glycine max]|nr:hypothetical protein GLYMA_02G062352v4 [Glycine max]KAH1058989.1 hypothetical protein GYH30_003180 [Glycine max]